MKIKRAVLLTVLAVAVAALAVPLVGLRTRAAGGPAKARALAPLTNASAAVAGPSTPAATPQQLDQNTDHSNAVSSGQIDQSVWQALGFRKLPAGTNIREVNQKIATRLLGPSRRNNDVTPQSGTPLVLDSRSALSASLATTIGGRDNQFSEVALIADWDGREDCTADREQKQDDFSFAELEIDFLLTRVAISEHTFANGFAENVIYYGDSVGNFWVGTDLNPGLNVSPAGAIDTLRQVNIPALVTTGASGGFTLLNRPAGDCTDDQVTVTGIAVNPVSDLGDFGLCGTIGEVVYVSTLDTEGCSASGANQPFRTRIFAFAFTDVVGGVAPAGALELLRSPLSNIAGVTVDDDSNLYFQLVDLLNFNNGGAIFKVTETPRVVAGCGPAPRINRVIASIPSGLSGGIGIGTAQGTTAAPVLTAAGYRLTNYSGPSTTFGNIVAITASGPCNAVYAAVARSFNSADDVATQNTEGLFTNPSALGATPSMIISFVDVVGGFDLCTAPAPGLPGPGGIGTLKIADGFADAAADNITRTPGVNNFRIFALGNGPDIRPATGGTAVVPGTPASVLKVDMQIDFQSHSGIAVSEEGTVFVISGGAPGGPGKNPSPMLGEILCFEDMCPMDRRADFVDLRGDGRPNPPASGGNVGDGDSDRFDHIWYSSPLDQVTLTPGGLSGLARGFLLYTNRTRTRNAGTLANLPNGGTQGDDDTDGPLIFEDFDAGHQVAGGDDQNPPFRGDDNDGFANPNTANNPVLVGPLSGGFEFLFGATGVPGSTCANNVWNAFFLNSNGNITFNGGDTDNTPTVPELRVGLPRIAPAWADLNPAARAVNPINFPVQALGFANVNAFRVRWQNVPEFGSEGCATTGLGIGGNSFGLTLYDDGTGLDENHNQLLDPADPTGDNIDPAFDLQEGPTDLRFAVEPTTGINIGCPPRLDGTGHFIFDYGRMDLLGTDVSPVITGYSVGNQSPLNPPGLCETNLSTAAVRADTGPFGVIDGQTATIQACLIGESTEPTIFELFNSGRGPSIGAGGEITFATPDFDLRCEGNDAAGSTATRQRDINRGKVGFFGLTCPVNPLCVAVTPVGTVAVAPGQPAVGSAAAGSQRDAAGNRIATPTSGIINAICNVQLNFLGCGFFPNEVTTVCQTASGETGISPPRPGKTVTSALALICDTNGDGIPETTIPLSSVTPTNRNLVRGTLATIGAGLNGTAFPLACCGGLANLTLTTTFTTGDNNIFGAFTRTTTCVVDLGVRAPVVISVTPSTGNCAITQDLLISGACFILPNGTANVTSVFAVDAANPNNVIQATRFVILNPNLIDAFFNFGSVNAGRRFLIFASGPNGTSQNLTTLPAGTQGCPAGFLGNPQGIQVTFSCESQQQVPCSPQGTPNCPCQPGSTDPNCSTINVAIVNGCRLDRSAAGTFTLTVSGTNIRDNALVTVGGVQAKKVKFKSPGTDPNTFQRVVLKGRFCSGLPGAIIVTNPGARASTPFQCNERCPAN